MERESLLPKSDEKLGSENSSVFYVQPLPSRGRSSYAQHNFSVFRRQGCEETSKYKQRLESNHTVSNIMRAEVWLIVKLP